MFTIILGFSAFFVALCGAYFSIIGIATLFTGSFFQVAVMASSLELGKLVATSFLYRYWDRTSFFIRTYLILAVLTLMGVTSIGVFGYLSAAYQVNSSKITQVDSKVALLEQQKADFNGEIEQINSRIDVLNKSRLAQEKRLPEMSSKSAAPVYADMERAAQEIKSLTERRQQIQTSKLEQDSNITNLKMEYSHAKDIGTFKFVSDVINKPLDTVVIAFICILICVFDPLAVTLLLAFNIAVKGKEAESKIIKAKQSSTKPISTPALTPILTPVPTVDSIPTENHTTINEVVKDVQKKVSPKKEESTSQISPEPTSRIWFSPEVEENS